MHVSDALISSPVAVTTGLIATGLLGIAAKKIQHNSRPDIVPLMGVLGAFVFAAQMINFSIPGTGSSGHLIGGIFLAAILGPWAAFLALSSILIVQCLFFADGGLIALGCNIINMAAFSCLIAYPLIYRPIAGKSLKPYRIALGAIIASIFALELGAFAVTLETELSGITALPFNTFIKFMLPIHLVIGSIEGIVTSALLIFVAIYRPAILNYKETSTYTGKSLKPVYIFFGVITLIFAAGFTVLASEYPDGLEWSIAKVAEDVEFGSSIPPTAIMPEYESGFSGIVGVVIVLTLIWGLSSLLLSKLKNKSR